MPKVITITTVIFNSESAIAAQQARETFDYLSQDKLPSAQEMSEKMNGFFSKRPNSTAAFAKFQYEEDMHILHLYMAHMSPSGARDSYQNVAAWKMS